MQSKHASLTESVEMQYFGEPATDAEEKTQLTTQDQTASTTIDSSSLVTEFHSYRAISAAAEAFFWIKKVSSLQCIKIAKKGEHQASRYHCHHDLSARKIGKADTSRHDLKQLSVVL